MDQSKFSEHTTECIHIGFAEEKKAYLLYHHECRKIFESRDVEFEELEDWERVVVDSDSEEEEVKNPPNAGGGDPGGDKVCKTVDSNDDDTIDAPSSPPKAVDHQVVDETPPDNPAHLSASLPLCQSTHLNKGMLPMCPDEDTRPHTRGTQNLCHPTPDHHSSGYGQWSHSWI